MKQVKRLSTHPLEQISLLRLIENYFYESRSYTVKLIQENEPVVLLVSGGIDSTVAWEWLLKNTRAHVYPLSIAKDELGFGFRYKQAVNYFSAYFANKYPGQSESVKWWSMKVSPPEVSKELKNLGWKFLHYRNRFRYWTGKQLAYGVGSLGLLQPVLYGMYYQQYLYDRFQIRSNSLVCGILPDDGLRVVGQTLTHMRLSQLLMSQIEGHADIQYVSPFFEPEWDQWLNKTEVVKLGIEWGIPLDKTWSCAGANYFTCGECSSCLNRKRVFMEAGIIRNDDLASKEMGIWIDMLMPQINLHLGIRRLMKRLIRWIRNFSDA